MNVNVDGLLAHNCKRVINEFRTVKNDSQGSKREMIRQILDNGQYNLPNSKNSKASSFTKLIIDSSISFLNS